VHRSRVQTRRLISLLGLLQGFVPAKELGKARRMLKRHHGLTRDLRDAQVGLKGVKPLANVLPEAAAFAGWLRKRRNRLGTRTHAALRRRGGKRLARLMESIEMSLREEAARIAPDRAAIRLQHNLDRAFERVIERDRRVDPADATTIHRTRVAFKRFAYMSEAVAPLLGAHLTGPRGAMKDLMAAMGMIQDNEVLLAALDRFERKGKRRGGSVVILRVGLVRRRSEMVTGYLKARAALIEFNPATSGRVTP
jgi:CHAD domain-containing protein